MSPLADQTSATELDRVVVVCLSGGESDSTYPRRFRALDWVDFVGEAPSVMRMRRFVDGSLVDEHVIPRDNDARLAALEISLFVAAGDRIYGRAGGLAVIAGESAPDLEANVIALLPVPYVMAAVSPAYSSARLQAMSGATAIFVHERDMAEWARRQIFPASATSYALPEAALCGLIEALSSHDDQGEPEAADGNGLLLVSYFAPPSTPVSVQRLAYWHSHLPQLWAELHSSEIGVHWLTATVGAREHERMIVVPDRGPLLVSDSWYRRYEDLRELGINPLGASWGYWVDQFARASDGYSTVVMSGNPFFYFELVRTFKEIWDAQVFLDFRDPFAHNPRFAYTPQQRSYLDRIERDWVAEADGVISVNDYCLDLIAPGVETRRMVVANGFDDTVVGRARRVVKRQNADRTRVAYSGTVFANLPIDDVVNALDPDRQVLVHFGRDYSGGDDIKDIALQRRGLIPYDQLIEHLMACDAGLIMTTGEASTQTTKLFDYIGCDLDVIIVTQGPERTGDLHAVTEGLAGVFWVKNEPKALRKFFSTYEPTRPRRPRRDDFSRRSQTIRLAEAMSAARSH